MDRHNVPALGWSLLALAALVACAPAGPASPERTDGSSAPAAPKTIVLGTLGSARVYGHMDYPTGGVASLTEIHSTGLATFGAQGQLEPRLASRLPSFEDGSVAVLPDGRMQTTWHVRPDVKWHDGAPFSARDVAMGWMVASQPTIPSPGSQVFREIESVDVPDPLTAVITWKRPFYRALNLTIHLLWPYPEHLLGDLLQGDMDTFRNLPYWTTEYVHLGPYRVVDFGLGENQVFEPFDQYFLGRARVDRIIVRSIADPNTLYANLQARAVDIAPEKTMPIDLAARLRDEWRQTGAGVVATRMDNWRYIWFQFRPEHARPAEMSRDVRIRRGLLMGLDRPALTDLLLAGLGSSEHDSFVPPSDPRAAPAGKPFARYPYDPPRASQELAAGGWRPGAGGRLVGPAGDAVQLSVRSSAAFRNDLAVIADYWRQLGAEVSEDVLTEAVSGDQEYRATFPGLEISSRTLDGLFSTFDSRLLAAPPNRFTAANKSGYSNPALDRLIDQFSSSVAERDQAIALRDLGEIMANDLPALPMYLEVLLAAVGKGVRALDDFPGTGDPRSLARNAHLWDRE